METISHISLVKNLNAVMQEMARDRTVYQITGNDFPNAVMMLQEDYESLLETLHLLSNPANTERLQKSIDQAKQKKFVEVEWDENNKMD